MKKLILTIILSTISLTYLFSQQAHNFNNFTLNNHQITWQKVFEKDSLSSLNSFLTQQKFTSNLIKEQNTYSGTSTKGKLKTKGLPIFSMQDFTGFITIEEKPTRYRVTISNIIFSGIDITLYGVSNKSEDPLEILAVKKDGSLRNNNYTNNTLTALDDYFNNSFTFTAPVSSEW